MVWTGNLMHIRRTSSLCKKARHLENQVISKLFEKDKIKEVLAQAVESGDIEETKEFWREKLENDQELFDLLEKITKIEQIILNEEERRVHKDEAALDKAINALPADSRAKLKAVMKHFGQVDSEIKKGALKIKRSEWDMAHDTDRMWKYWAFQRFKTKLGESPEERLAKASKWALYEERKVVKKVSKAQDDFDDDVGALIKALDHNKTEDAEKIIDKITADAFKVIPLFKKEMREILKVIHYTNIILINLVHAIYDKAPEQLKAVLDKGFPPQKLKDIKDEEDRLIAHVHDGLRKSARIASYEYRKAA